MRHSRISRNTKKSRRNKHAGGILNDPMHPVGNIVGRVRSGVSNAYKGIKTAASKAVNGANTLVTANFYKNAFLPKPSFNYNDVDRDFEGGRRTRKRGQKSKKRRQR